MKKIFALCLMALIGTFAASAQKYALIDMDFILKKIPQYEIANQQLNQQSKIWQQELSHSISSTRPIRSISLLSRRPSERTLSSLKRRKYRTSVSSTSVQKATSIRSATAS